MKSIVFKTTSSGLAKSLLVCRFVSRNGIFVQSVISLPDANNSCRSAKSVLLKKSSSCRFRKEKCTWRTSGESTHFVVEISQISNCFEHVDTEPLIAVVPCHVCVLHSHYIRGFLQKPNDTQTSANFGLQPEYCYTVLRIEFLFIFTLRNNKS